DCSIARGRPDSGPFQARLRSPRSGSRFAIHGPVRPQRPPESGQSRDGAPMLKPILIALFLVAVAASRLPVIDSDAVGVLAYEQDKPATPAAPARLEVPLA